MGSEPGATAPMLVEEALNRALAGDPYSGGMLLVPLIEDSHRECFALCAMLATTCTYGTEPQGPDGMFVLEVEDVLTGEAGRPEDLPPDAQFAAEFVTAWANKDEVAARALFDALAADTDTEAGVGRVVDGVLALYGMAIASVRALIEERINPTQRED
ncbi:hypothetical protein ACWDBO_37335 [Streptomyces mirabilis]|uniref:hypothetical protein n=1 Tax=Streptomyces mirabilis TaxID=68239 RepID=UPI00332FA342